MKHLSLRDFVSAQTRRQFLEKQLKISLNNLADSSFTEESVAGRNIENLIGSTQIPLGIAGPVSFKSANSKLQTHYIPLATTEGALVASISRGCKAISESRGAYVELNKVGVTRSPVFITSGIKEAVEVKKWLGENFQKIKRITDATSSHLELLKIESIFAGRNLFIRFFYDSEEAMGMNMATIATQEAVRFIERNTKIRCVSVSGNYDVDKKPSWLNFISGRGKRIWADVTLRKQVVRQILKTDPVKMAEVVYRKNLLGSAMSGSMGFNAHFANPIAAIFAATGQDLAHVVEGSLGITTAEVLKNGDLYFSVYLPSIMCGTVGGGTHLPSQQAALKIMGAGDVLEYCRVLGVAVLASEISLIASLAEGNLAGAHKKLARKGKK